MQGLSLVEQPQLEAWLILNNSNDDKEFDFDINEFGSEVEDDQNNLLHEMTLPLEDMMDQGLDDLINEEAPTKIINLIL